MNGNPAHRHRYARSSARLDERLTLRDILLCDISASMDEPGFEDGKTKRQIVDEAIREYLAEKREHRPQDYVTVVAFEDAATVCCELVNVGAGYDRVCAALDCMNGLCPGGTKMKKGLRKAANLVRRPAGFDAPGCERVRVLAYSDGFDYDTGSAVRLARKLKNWGLLIETFGVGRDPSDVDEAFLREVATTENGFVHYRFLGDGQSIRDTFSALATGVLTFED